MFVEVVEALVSKYETRSRSYGHPTEMAETIEQWQIFEMENTDQRTLCHVTAMVLKNESFRRMLEQALQSSQEQVWTRDGAALVLRLHSLLRTGQLRLEHSEVADIAGLLERVVSKTL